MKFRIFLISLLVVLPVVALAWQPGDPIVPCGTAASGKESCGLCDFMVLIDNLVSFLTLVLILPAGVIALMVAGFLLVTASGDVTKIERGRSIFRYALLGLLIAFASYLIINTILGKLLKDGYVPWDTFPGCPGGSASSIGSSFTSSSGTYDPGITDYVPTSQTQPTTPASAGIEFSDTLSLEMNTFKNCFQGKLSEKVGYKPVIITSTTDNNIAIVGRCDPTNHSGTQVFGNPNACQHTEYSCHYGGRNDDCVRKGSYAIDIDDKTQDGTTIPFDKVREAAVECENALPGYSSDPIARCNNEVNHYHISIGDVNNCNCDTSVSYCNTESSQPEQSTGQPETLRCVLLPVNTSCPDGLAPMPRDFCTRNSVPCPLLYTCCVTPE